MLGLKAKDIRVKRKKLNRELVELNKAEKKLNNLKRLKPREYKAISEKEKNEIQFAYHYHNARRESMEKEIEKIENMSPFEY